MHRFVIAPHFQFVYKLDEGRLIKVSTVRGRERAIEAHADRYGELAYRTGEPLFISHGQCLEEAQELANMIKDRDGVEVTLITDIGPIIGSRSGPAPLHFSLSVSTGNIEEECLRAVG